MAGMFAIILIVTNQFYHGKTEQTTGMLCSLPIAVGWSLDESPVQPAF